MQWCFANVILDQGCVHCKDGIEVGVFGLWAQAVLGHGPVVEWYVETRVTLRVVPPVRGPSSVCVRIHGKGVREVIIKGRCVMV